MALKSIQCKVFTLTKRCKYRKKNTKMQVNV